MDTPSPHPAAYHFYGMHFLLKLEVQYKPVSPGPCLWIFVKLYGKYNREIDIRQRIKQGRPFLLVSTVMSKQEVLQRIWDIPILLSTNNR